MADPKKISVIISGQDRISGVLGQAEKSVGSFGLKLEKLNTGLSALTGFASLLSIGGLAKGLGLADVPADIAKAEQAYAQLSNRYSDLEKNGSKYRSILAGIAKETGESSGDLRGGIGNLINAGFDNTDISAPLELGAKLVKAYETNIDDATAAEGALVNNMHVAGKDLQATFGGISASTEDSNIKLGALYKMLPGLTESAKLLGIHGKDGVVSLGAAAAVLSHNFATTEESTGALGEVLDKIVGKRAVKNFLDLRDATGIDILTPMIQAAKEGKDPIEAFAAAFSKLTEGKSEVEKSLLLNQILRGQSVKTTRDLIDHIDEYRRRRDEGAVADKKIDEDYTRAMETLINQFDILKEKTKFPLKIILSPIMKGLTLTEEGLNHIPGVGVGLLAGLSYAAYRTGKGVFKGLKNASKSFRTPTGAPDIAPTPAGSGLVDLYGNPITPAARNYVKPTESIFSRLTPRIGNTLSRLEPLFKVLDRVALPLNAFMNAGQDIFNQDSAIANTPSDADILKRQYGVRMAGAQPSQSKVTVDFKNVPKGTRIDADTTGNVDLQTKTGVQW